MLDVVRTADSRRSPRKKSSMAETSAAETIQQRLLDHRQAHFGRHRLALRIGRGDGDLDLVARASGTRRLLALSVGPFRLATIFTRRSRSTVKGLWPRGSGRSGGLLGFSSLHAECPRYSALSTASALCRLSPSVITATERSKFGASCAVIGIESSLTPGFNSTSR